MTRSFADAFRATTITHETIDADDLFDDAVSLGRTAHLLLDQRDTARAVAVTLEGQVHLLRVALASADSALGQSPMHTTSVVTDVRAAIARALDVTA